MNILIIKLGATGDVVRTTTLLRTLKGQITWVTAAKNTVLLRGLQENLQCFSWEDREQTRDRGYDLVVNLEDTLEIALFLQTIKHKQLFGAYADSANRMQYSDDSRRWFDLSLISVYGREQADKRKLQNRHTYQELIFEGLGLKFKGEKYLLPDPVRTSLTGDVAIAAEAGPVWPMKNWAHYDNLKNELQASGLVVNVLPQRASLLEHLGDVAGHRCLVGGDSLPMHMALASNTRCVSIFNCTSPWEIYDYGLLQKIISPRLGDFFYKRDFDPCATTAVSLQEVLSAVRSQLKLSAG